MVQKVNGKFVTKDSTKLEIEDIKQKLTILNNRKKRLEGRLKKITLLSTLTQQMRKN